MIDLKGPGFLQKRGHFLRTSITVRRQMGNNKSFLNLKYLEMSSKIAAPHSAI